MDFKIYHDGFKWKKTEDIVNFQLSSGSFVTIESVSQKNTFIIGVIKSINGEMLNSDMPYGAIHIASSNILTLWENEYYAQVYVDTLERMKENWNIEKIIFNTPFEYALFQSLPRLVHMSIVSGIKPIDIDLEKFGNKYSN